MKEIISSIKNPRIKRFRLLKDTASYRDTTGCFVLEGVRLIRDSLEAGAVPEEIFYDERLLKREGGEELLTDLLSRGAHVMMAEESLIDRLSDTVTPQGIIGVFKAPPLSFYDILENPGKGVLVLDGLQDPGNVGTLIRTAAAFDMCGVLLLPGCADAFNMKTLRATAGSIFRLPVIKATTSSMEQLKERGFKVVVADINGGIPMDKVDLRGAPALVVGSEGGGPSEEILQLADEVVTIPMANQVESLNVAVAGSILIYEAFTQRR